MFYIIFAFFALYFAFFLVSKRYRNPYTLTMVFGKKGSGKTCLMTREIIKHQKMGWTVYADFPVNISGVRIFSARDLDKFTPDSNSLICIDEAGITFGNRDYKSFSKGLIEWFKLQRHYKVKVIFNSQSWDVDKKLRELTDSLILQTNIGNVISISRPIIRSITLTEPSSDSESRIADSLKFGKFWTWRFYFMPKYFRYFKSFDKPERPALPYTFTEASSLFEHKPERLLNRLRSRSAKADIINDEMSSSPLQCVDDASPIDFSDIDFSSILLDS